MSFIKYYYVKINININFNFKEKIYEYSRFNRTN